MAHRTNVRPFSTYAKINRCALISGILCGWALRRWHSNYSQRDTNKNGIELIIPQTKPKRNGDSLGDARTQCFHDDACTLDRLGYSTLASNSHFPIVRNYGRSGERRCATPFSRSIIFFLFREHLLQRIVGFGKWLPTGNKWLLQFHKFSIKLPKADANEIIERNESWEQWRCCRRIVCSVLCSPF